MIKKIITIKMLISLSFLLSITNVFSSTLEETQSDKVLYKSMTQSLEKFLILTNYLERHKYIYRHDARTIINDFNTAGIVSVEKVKTFGSRVESLKKDILANQRVKQDVKERVESQINDIQTNIQLAFAMRDAVSARFKSAQQIASAERQMNDFVRIKKANMSINKEVIPFSSALSWVLGGVLFMVTILFAIFRRSYFKKEKVLKKELTSSIEKRKSLEKSPSLTSSFKDVLKTLDSPMSIVIDFEGKVLGSTKSFNNYFGKHFSVGSDNWDTFFEENLYVSRDDEDELGSYKFRKDTFSRLFITSQLIEKEKTRFMTFRIIDTEELVSLKNSTISCLENGVSSANEVFEDALSEFSKLYKLKNIKLKISDSETELKTYSDRDNLKEMFLKKLVFLNTVQDKIVKDELINVCLDRIDGVLSLKATVEGIDFSLDMNEAVKDSIRDLSKFVSEFDGEFIIRKESLREITRTIFDLRVYDRKTAFHNKSSAVIENKIGN